ncbi:hypothetical protein [Vibrio jasicida]|uniref:hypothetical protein n=1 Tax=Vibrio jasicida TaxID=766224 RepID=UPI0005EE9EDD|nr:hypothetical protein [Vibrio jasicida]
MIETRYLDFEGLKTTNQVAYEFAEFYDLTTYDNEFLDTDNDEDVEDFLRLYDYKFNSYIRSSPINKIEVDIDENGFGKRFSLSQFKSNLLEVDEDKEGTFIFNAIQADLIKVMDIEVNNDDYDSKNYQIVIFYEDDRFSYYIFDTNESDLISYELNSIDEVEQTIKNHFESEDLDSNITLGLEEVQIRDSLELDMLKMSFIDQGFPKNHFLKTTDKYGSDFFTSKCEKVYPSTLSLDEVDVDLLTLLKRDSEAFQKKDESVDLKQDQKKTHRSRNRPR